MTIFCMGSIHMRQGFETYESVDSVANYFSEKVNIHVVRDFLLSLIVKEAYTEEI